MNKKDTYKPNGNEPLEEKTTDRLTSIVKALNDDKLSDDQRELLIAELGSYIGDDELEEVVTQAFAEAITDDAYAELKPTPEETQSLKNVKSKIDGKIQPVSVSAKTENKKSRLLRLSVVWRVAAVMLPALIITSAGYFAGWFDRGTQDGTDVGKSPIVAQTEIAVLTTQAVEGVQKDVTLCDNSVVWVNSGSKITYPEAFADDVRHVHLSGEAFFDVARNESAPFIVETDRLQVTVLGTTFNVTENMERGTTEVVLHSGLVQVTAGDKIAKLAPQDKLTLHHDSGEMDVERLGTLQDWRAEVLMTGNRTLPQLFRMIENYYDTEIVFDEAQFAADKYFFSALAKERTAQQVLKALSISSNGAFDYREENGRIIIEKR